MIVARDAFTGTTAGNALNARTADAGGTWATSGSATDLTFADPTGTITSETITRATASDASGRFAILGTATPTDVEVETFYRFHKLMTVAGEMRMGVIARWTDSSNYVRATLIRDYTAGVHGRTLEVRQIVAGVETVIASAAVASSAASTQVWQVIRLIAFSSGRVIAEILNSSKTATLAIAEGTSTALGPGGALASGKSGVYDAHTSATGSLSRYYDDPGIATPAPEHVVMYASRQLDIRSDSTIRESSAGGTWGRPPSYRGSRFKVGPAGSENRTTRVVVLAHRNNLDAGGVWEPLTDQLTIDATFRPRCSVVPR